MNNSNIVRNPLEVQLQRLFPRRIYTQTQPICVHDKEVGRVLRNGEFQFSIDVEAMVQDCENWIVLSVPVINKARLAGASYVCMIDSVSGTKRYLDLEFVLSESVPFAQDERGEIVEVYIDCWNSTRPEHKVKVGL